ncbi:potassium channel family protein [Thermomonas sp.]|uniref:potassium channel family protein n=1 Tax=Thermomonas sp. TaxID=1971895 RepID=UPI002489BFE2|nr:potassium channel family protein [Thermomonas sp.]MDI1251679.1 potassium channel family protein [Thermomonas sp.]
MDWLIPSGQLGEHVLVALVAFLVTSLVVIIHYEGLHWLAKRHAGRTPKHDHRAVLKIIFQLLALHIVEIWCYGLVYWGLTWVPDTGFVHGEHGMDRLFDAVYFSAATFSTVGFGDLSPVGAIRLVAGLEAVTGLLLITWSASFTYLEMSRLWTRRG